MTGPVSFHLSVPISYLYKVIAAAVITDCWQSWCRLSWFWMTLTNQASCCSATAVSLWLQAAGSLPSFPVSSLQPPNQLPGPRSCEHQAFCALISFWSEDNYNYIPQQLTTQQQPLCPFVCVMSSYTPWESLARHVMSKSHLNLVRWRMSMGLLMNLRQMKKMKRTVWMRAACACVWSAASPAVGVDGCDGVVGPAVHGVMPGTGQLFVDCRHGNISRL